MSTKRISVADGFVVEENHDLPEFYVDGISDSFLGTPVSKVTFHTVAKITDDGKEFRTPKVRITIQTAALVEFCRNLLALASQNDEQIKQGYDLSKTQFAAIVDGVDLKPYIAPETPKNNFN